MSGWTESDMPPITVPPEPDDERLWTAAQLRVFADNIRYSNPERVELLERAAELLTHRYPGASDGEAVA